MDRRFKAFTVALFMAMALIAGARYAAAEDDWVLRMLCAPWERHSAMWVLLGCYQCDPCGLPPMS